MIERAEPYKISSVSTRFTYRRCATKQAQFFMRIPTAYLHDQIPLFRFNLNIRVIRAYLKNNPHIFRVDNRCNNKIYLLGLIVRHTLYSVLYIIH